MNNPISKYNHLVIQRLLGRLFISLAPILNKLKYLEGNPRGLSG